MKFPEKFNSDRLWALIAYGVLLIANVQLSLGIEPEAMTELSYVVIAFVLGKSIRGTGSALAALIPAFATAAVPEIEEPKRDLLDQLTVQLRDRVSRVSPTQPPASRRGTED